MELSFTPLLIGFVALAESFGLEILLGAFLAGAILTLLDRDQTMTHPRFRVKLEAAGCGVFIPIFFVTSGIQFDAGALFESGSTISRVPLFLAALLVVRGVPALLYARTVTRRETLVAALLQLMALTILRRGEHGGVPPVREPLPPLGAGHATLESASS